MNYRRRLIKTTLVFLKIFLTFRKELRLYQSLGYKKTQQRMAEAHTRRATELYDIAVEYGGVFIKLCQFFSARRDIFPEPYITVLSPLQDEVPPVAFEELEEVLEFGFTNHRQVFRKIDKKPLASASLGQTHRAELNDGTQVVLKILKPGVKRTIDIDCAILFLVFSLLSRFRSVREKVDLPQLLDEFIRVTGDELNFQREIYVLEILKEKLKKFPFVHIPQVYQELSCKDIIVMEYCEGDKISEISSWKHRNNDPAVIAQQLVDIYMEQFLEIGWVHFDPHPGNILVTSDNNFVLLDFGMAGQISTQNSEGLRRGLRTIVQKDYMGLLDVFDELGFIRKGYNRYKLLPVMEYFFGEVFSTLKIEREALQSVDLSPVVDEMVELIYKQPITLPVEWAFVGRSIGTLSGIIATLNPDFKVSDAFEPYLNKIVSSSITEVIDGTKNYAKNYGVRLLNLPLRLSHLVEKVERGELRFKIELDEVDERIVRVQATLLSTLCWISSLFCIGAATILYSIELGRPALYFLVMAASLFLFGLFKRKNRQKEFIKTQLLGVQDK